MDIQSMVDKIKARSDYHEAGMILCHNGVVRRTTREGREVTGLKVKVDHDLLKEVVDEARAVPGILDVLVEIQEGRLLTIGEDIMIIVVAGDIRENVIQTLQTTLDRVKTEVTTKEQYFK